MLGIAVASRTGVIPTGGVDALGRLSLSADGSGMRALEVGLGDDLLPKVGNARWESDRLPTTTHSMVAFTWDRDESTPGVQISSRRSGSWSAWRSVPLQLDLPDGDDAEWGIRTGTQLVWIGASDGIRIRLGAHRPPSLMLVLLHPGRLPGDEREEPLSAPLARSEAQAGVPPRPTMRGRSQWGADESWRNGDPRYNVTIEQVHIHHTANSNDYSEEDVPAILRGIYRYHARSLGWSDIAYNFLVDRFGRIWVGRAGGAAKPVRGAHTLGFNATSTGFAVIGNHELVQPSPQTIGALVRLTAWKLGMYQRDPEGTVAVLSEGSDKYAASQVVVLPVVDGHRDTNDTACPGTLLYARLPAVRRRAAKQLAGAADPGVVITQPFALSGDAAAGAVLSIAPGAYTPADAAVSYTWLRDGVPTGDDPATAARTCVPEDVGHQLGVVVTVAAEGYASATQQLATPAPVETTAVLDLRARPRHGNIRVTLAVTAPGLAVPPAGRVRIRADQRKARTVELVDGRAVVRLTGFGPGKHRIKATYLGLAPVRRAKAQTTVRVRRHRRAEATE